MSSTVKILWNGEPISVDRSRLETAWLVWQEVHKPNDRFGSLVLARDVLQKVYGFDKHDAIQYAIAASHWNPGL